MQNELEISPLKSEYFTDKCNSHNSCMMKVIRI